MLKGEEEPFMPKLSSPGLKGKPDPSWGQHRVEGGSPGVFGDLVVEKTERAWLVLQPSRS